MPQYAKWNEKSLQFLNHLEIQLTSEAFSFILCRSSAIHHSGMIFPSINTLISAIVPLFRVSSLSHFLFFNFFLIGPSFGWIWFDIKILSFCWLSLAQFVIICCCFLFLMFSLFVWSFDLSAFFAPLSLNEWLWSGIV